MHRTYIGDVVVLLNLILKRSRSFMVFQRRKLKRMSTFLHVVWDQDGSPLKENDKFHVYKECKTGQSWINWTVMSSKRKCKQICEWLVFRFSWENENWRELLCRHNLVTTKSWFTTVIYMIRWSFYVISKDFCTIIN